MVCTIPVQGRCCTHDIYSAFLFREVPGSLEIQTDLHSKFSDCCKVLWRVEL